MKTLIKSSVILSLFFLLTSFLWANDNYKETCNLIINSSTTTVDFVNNVIITYKKPDVCNLNYLGKVKVTEKFLFFNNNSLKPNTIAELKKQASEKGGTIVYVYSELKNGFAIGFSRTVSACVFKK